MRQRSARHDASGLQSLRDAGMTLEEIGQELGVSRERIRQLEARALVKCRAWCDRHGYRVEDMLREW